MAGVACAVGLRAEARERARGKERSEPQIDAPRSRACRVSRRPAVSLRPHRSTNWRSLSGVRGGDKGVGVPGVVEGSVRLRMGVHA